MKILIDIGHPAHVHYFRNFIKIMTGKGHEFLIIARDKEVIFDLLKKFNIPFRSRGKGGIGFFGKLLYILWADIILIRLGLNFKPDLLLSFASTYAAHTSFFLQRPHIAFDDTEHSKFEIFLYRPFTSVFINPQWFNKDLGNKQVRFNGFMELCYLRPNYFQPDNSVLVNLKIKSEEPFVLLRFVSWSAAHDHGEKGFSLETKIKLVMKLSEHFKVFISSENTLPEELKSFKLPVAPDKFHDVLYHSALYIGEGATTASECVMLGTPSIYVNSLSAGTLEEQERQGLLFAFRNPEGVFEKAMEIINDPQFKDEYKFRHNKMINNTIDVTAFMVWFIENYPESLEIMKEHPDYQYQFK